MRDYLCFFCEVEETIYIGLDPADLKKMQEPLFYLPFPVNMLMGQLPDGSQIKEIAITTEKNVKAIVEIKRESILSEKNTIKKTLKKFFGKQSEKPLGPNVIRFPGAK